MIAEVAFPPPMHAATDERNGAEWYPACKA
jgi:hypothetical protein